MNWFGKTGMLGMFCLAGALACAQQSAPSGITVTYVYPKLTVSVSQTSDLTVVLAKLCKETQSDCDGIDLATSSKVSPGTLRGSWGEVVDQLMEGSRLNYAVSSPSAKSRGRLIVQGNKLTLPDAVPSMQNNLTTEANSMAPAMNGSAPPSENGNESAQNTNASPQEMPYAGSMSATQSNGAGNTAMGNYQNSSPGLQASPLTSNMLQSSAPQRLTYSPFPDSHGNPVPINDEPVLYSPFPDSHGNLVPVDPNKSVGSPFPLELMRRSNSNH